VSLLSRIPRPAVVIAVVALVVLAAWGVMVATSTYDDFLHLFPKKLIRRVTRRGHAMYPVLFIALVLQTVWPAIRRSPKVLTGEFWLDFYYWFQSAILKAFGVFFFCTLINKQLWGGLGPWFPAVRELPFPVQVFLALWLKDFIVYWRHRLEHTLTVLWSFHAVHHSSEQVDVMTTHRLHPGELAIGILVVAPILCVGFDHKAVVLAYAIYGEWNHFIHLNVNIKAPGFLKYIFVTPFMHQWHHAVDEASIGKNVGVVFAWNDWIFGSAYHPDHWPEKFGFSVPAAESLPPSNIVRHWLYPLQLLVARLRKRFFSAPTA
jgi:sterol desaturase/sphingolipid hydroxylase (fatty acid hydroxylase superfamily)